MGKIIVLDENTANKIAAGEIIERPSSLVKELVENSIDAGASSINVEIRNGGISYIRISDNGSGIYEDDAELAFERHATSKIRNSKDLDSISTLGFRGEALASIAAVSSMELSTRVAENNYGTYLKIEGGNIKEIKQTGCPVGTTFTIRNLFYNTPARFKFLKKDSTEAGYVSDIISRIALGNPHISFRLTSSGASIIHTPGNNDLLSTIFSIYGKEIAKGMLEVKYQNERISVTGYTGLPDIARSNRNYQSLYINGRYIKSKIITAAIDEAYKTLLMKNKYPFTVINISLNPVFADINVHPSKMEVKFSDEQELFRSIYHAIKGALLQGQTARSLQIEEKQQNPFIFRENENSPKQYVQQKFNYRGAAEVISPIQSVSSLAQKNKDSYIDTNNKNMLTQSVSSNNINATADSDNYKIPEISKNTGALKVNKVSEKLVASTEIEGLKIPGAEDMATATKISEASSISGIKISEIVNIGEDSDTSGTADILEYLKTSGTSDTAKAFETSIADKNAKTPETIEELRSQEVEYFNSDSSITKQQIDRAPIFDGFIPIGQLFSTYIIFEKESEIILVDQHAAHERLKYEELMQRFYKKEINSQYLLSPVVLELTYQEIKFIEEEKNFFEKLGFTYEDFGNNSIIIRSVPVNDIELDVKDVFLSIIDTAINSIKAGYEKTADEIIYSMACKSAVKANKKLDLREMQELLDSLEKLSNPYTCPHGRPTVLYLKRYELEKMFKRIV